MPASECIAATASDPFGNPYGLPSGHWRGLCLLREAGQEPSWEHMKKPGGLSIVGYSPSQLAATIVQTARMVWGLEICEVIVKTHGFRMCRKANRA